MWNNLSKQFGSFAIQITTLAVIATACGRQGETKTTLAMSETDDTSAISRKLEAIRESGYPVTLEDLEHWKPFPPESENAALLFTSAFDLLVAVPADAPALPSRLSPLSPSVRKLFQQIVATNKVAIARLVQVPSFIRSRYLINPEMKNAYFASVGGRANRAGRVIQIKAFLDIEEKRIDAALVSIRTLFSLAESLAEEPDAGIQWSRVGTLQRGYRATQWILNQNALTDGQLAMLQENLKRSDVQQARTLAFVSERCHGIHLLEHTDELVTFLTQLVATNGSLTANEVIELKANYMRNKHADYLFYLDVMERLIATSKCPETQLLDTARGISAKIAEQRQKPPDAQFVFSLAMLPWCADSATIQFAEISTLGNVARCAVAIERYRLAHSGQLPPDLNSLTPQYLDEVPIDPFDGKPLRYQRRSKGYVIYSVGGDCKDDGGKETDDSSLSKEGYDITFVHEPAS
jgi:hypothetical protein